jgi:predicted glycosyltransferase
VTLRALFHVQHLLGIGHVMRVAQVARETVALGLEVTVLSGGGRLGLDWGGAEVRELPSARARDGSFKVLVDEKNQPLDAAFYARRRALVLEAFESVQPDVVLMESYPFGRRAFREELDPLIAAARARRPRAPVLVSIRDILVAKSNPARYTEIAERIRRDIDAVLVHGDPTLVQLEASFPAAPAIADKVRYTGYVTDPRSVPTSKDNGVGRGEVLVSAGGGAVGAPLLWAALRARPLSSVRDRTWRLIAGPNLPQADFDAVAADLSTGVILERFRSDFQNLLRNCHVSLSQAGYNTILDVLQAGARAVVVPFAAGGETEQALRARILAERGLVQVVDAEALGGPDGGVLLAQAIDRALEGPVPVLGALALDGARQAAECVAGFARHGLGR